MPSSIGLIAASNRLLLAAIIPRGIPITIEISERIIRLPMFYNLKTKEIEYIVEKILMYQNFT